MKKILSILLLVFLNVPNVFPYSRDIGLNSLETRVLTFGDNTCKDIKQSDIPTIFIPGILASWYSERGLEDSKIKEWIPDPITHSYDTLFYTFKKNGYELRNVRYLNEFNTLISGDPKSSLYLFGYDWKKDNMVTAKILSNLILQIRKEYEYFHGCDIGKVNLIGHSMGGLVARAMLEDMCVSDYDLENFYDRTGLQDGELKSFLAEKCNYTMINNFVTISTPQRGSPSTFPLWEKGDLGQTEPFLQSIFLRGQLGVNSDYGLYELIHGYSKNIPNGIITLGQLLPDLQNKNQINDQLLFLEKNGEKLSRNVYSKNTFLERLNSQENIDKMFENISGKFYLYYSTLTGEEGKNNIIGFDIKDKYLLNLSDKTEKHIGNSIYSKFPKIINDNIFNIEKNIRNFVGLGGDGTVPSSNLLLTYNDSNSLQMLSRDKLEVNKIDCFDNTLLELNGFGDLYKVENQLTKKLGIVPLQLCSHSKMPILTSIQIYEKISGNNLTFDSNLNHYSIFLEQISLYKNIGYANYNVTLYNTFNYVFPNLYSFLFTNLIDVEYFIKNKNSDNVGRIDIGMGNVLVGLIRYEIKSPINVIIEDELGRKIGINPQTGDIINQIPGAWTSGNTQGSREPEFFLIPKTGSGKISHKINTYGTGDGEYHIVINEIKQELRDGETEANLVIAGNTKKGEQEKYLVGITSSGATFDKIILDENQVLKNEKYEAMLEKLYKVIDIKLKKMSREDLKNRLIEFRNSNENRLKNNDKLRYILDELIRYL